jgi:uncharacterized membrane protein
MLMTQPKQRFEYIDQFRGFIGILMLLGHSSYYLNSVWLQLDAFDPLFPSWSQFALRFAGYLCAPGFLIMAGAMVWLSFTRSIEKGMKHLPARWYFIQRGIFLVLIQMTLVNSAWGGFSSFNFWHLGIISTIGISMILLSFLITFSWHIRLATALLLLACYPLMLTISYDQTNTIHVAVMETFLFSGDFNKYPVIPWFALALIGSVMSNFWFRFKSGDRKKVLFGAIISLSFILSAIIIRLCRGYGNIFEFDRFGSISFFAEQKYPPALFHLLFFTGMVIAGVTFFMAANRFFPKLSGLFSIPGKVPLFFYCIHLSILGVVVKRLDFYYLQGDILTTFIGFAILLIVMFPLSRWFYSIKLRSNNFFIRMI